MLTVLQDAILRTVSYADVFDYPLTKTEIHRYLEGIPATLEEVATELSNGRLQLDYLSQVENYYCLSGREETISIRCQRAKRAQRLWPLARRYGRLITHLPFIRLVAVTGSLAMNNPKSNADIDYFIVTENGRLWLARAGVIAIVRLAAQRGINLCPNYFLAEDRLALPEQNLYTAHEIAQMKPLSGMIAYERLRRKNPWTQTFIPNAAGPPTADPPTRLTCRWLQSMMEWPLSTAVGYKLEQWEQRRKIPKLTAQNNSIDEVRFSAAYCKGHFEAHQQHTLAAYRKRMGLQEADLCP